MSIARAYLHEKADESRHNEIIAYIVFLAGSVFFVGGILSSLSMGREPNWLLFIPYIADSTPLMLLELVFLLTGLSLIFSGIGVGVHHYRDRSWYMREMGKANNAENLMRAQRLQVARPFSVPKTRSVSRRKKSSE